MSVKKDHDGRSAQWIAIGLLAVLLVGGATYAYVAMLHEARTDEAVFSRASLEILDGDLLLHHWRVMKPFMVYYAQALSRFVLGKSIFAGRMPGVLATILCLWFLFRIGRFWFDDRVGLLAAAMMALSPYVLFNFPTARADALAMFFTMWAIDLAGRRKIGWAGFAYALAFCTRQLVALSFPLVMAVAFFAGYLHDDPGTPMLKNMVRRTWRFFLGTLGPLVVLAVWSLFTKIPFAWLVNEMQGDKYETGTHLSVGFVSKMSYWLARSLDYFAFAPFSVLALALIPIVTIILLAMRSQGRWKSRTRPDLAMLLLFAAFALYFYIIHSIGFFTMYLRFLVPVLPWVMLVFAWLLMLGSRQMIRHSGPVIKYTPHVLGVMFGLIIVIGAGRYLQELAQPIAEDDVPAAVEWIENNARPDAVIFTSDYGPEVDFASWGTRVKSKQFDRDPKRFRKELPNYVGRDLFLYLDGRDAERWKEMLAQLLAPHFELEHVAAQLTQAGKLYRVQVRTVGGREGEEIVYLSGEEFVHAPFGCDVLLNLAAEAFAQSSRKDEKHPFGLDQQWCMIGDEQVSFGLSLRNLEYQKIRIDRAEFAFQNAELDWHALAVPRRLVVRRAAEATATFHIGLASLAEFVQRKNKNLTGVSLAVKNDRLIIEAAAVTPIWQPKVEVTGKLRLEGQTLLFEVENATLDGRAVPRFAVRYAQELMNPILEADLQTWGMQASRVSLSETNYGEVELTATTKK